MTNPAIPPQFLQISYKERNGSDGEWKRTLPFADSGVFRAKIRNATVLSKGEDVKTVYAISISTEGIVHEFEPGDTIGILPANNENEINKIFELLDVNLCADKLYELGIFKDTLKKKPSVPAHVPPTGTLRTLFRNYLDIRSPPKKLFLKMLSSYVNDDSELAILNNLCGANGSQDYEKFLGKEGKSLLRILETFSSCKVPVERLLEFLPPLLPRPYSIASSPLNSSAIKIVLSVVCVDSELKGVCSGFLQEIVEDFLETKTDNSSEISLYFRKPNAFRLPEDVSKPMILIGPGTGVAPFIGFLDHLHTKKQISSFDHGSISLFYGCRYSDKDFLFKKEMYEHVKSGLLQKLFTSFSRESDKKMYVQDNIIKNGAEIVNKILSKDALIFVCGDAKNMMVEVKSAIISCLAKHGTMEIKEAEEYVADMFKSNRYIQDIWL